MMFMSSAGSGFALIQGTPPLLKASWRLWATSIVQIPGLIWQWHHASPAVRSRLRGSLPVLLLSGVLLGVHFGAWVWSIDHTSLAHSLLWVSSHPLVIVVGMWLGFVSARCLASHKHRRKQRSRNVQPTMTAASGTAAVASTGQMLQQQQQQQQQQQLASPSTAGHGGSDGDTSTALDAQQQQQQQLLQGRESWCSMSRWSRPNVLETVGAIVGFAGGAVMVLDAGGSGSAITVAGDAVAFLGAVAMVGYLASGRVLRQWMPLFLYAFPVTLTSAVVTWLASMALGEDVSFGGTSARSLFGWLFAWKPLLLVLYQALGPGLLGHTMVNGLLRHLSPLIVSVTLLLEPVSGSLIGWLLGVQAVPGVWTVVGGPALVIGAVMVTIGQHRSRSDSTNTATAPVIATVAVLPNSAHRKQQDIELPAVEAVAAEQ